jgi:hypothetical protein
MQKSTKPLPPIESVKSVLSYDAASGLLHWINSTGKAKAGSVAGCEAKGYILIGVAGRLLKAHRLAWLLHYGSDPANDIDHINGVRSDNRIANLREANQSQNMHNRRADKDNSSGIKGVCWNKWKGKWMAYVNGKHYGYFLTKEEAGAAARSARELLHGQFACHRV